MQQNSSRFGGSLRPSAGVRIYSPFSIATYWLALLTTLLIAFPASATPSRSSRAVSPADDRLVHSPTDNYIAGMEYADFWQRKCMPLKIYIHPTDGVDGFDANYIEVFRNASQSWSQATDGLVKFQLIDDPAGADIDVQWTGDTSSWNKTKTDGNELGICEPEMLMNEGIQHASIKLLTKSKGKHVGLNAMQFASLHELGHALGLGHSERHSDIMARTVTVSESSFEGAPIIEACRSDIALTPRDITTIKIVYAAKQKLDEIRQKHLSTGDACYQLCTEAAHQISAGDSGQAIIFLREVLNLDNNYKLAMQNLMAAYFNCGVELYNKQHYSEALPVLNRSLELAARVGSASELSTMRSVQRNCMLALNQTKQPWPSSPTNTQSTYSGRTRMRGSH